MMEEQVRKAAEAFRQLLEEQIERERRMAAGEPAKDFSSLEKTVIGIAGGDGIGPAIVEQAEKVLRRLLAEELEKGTVELRRISGT